jgi:hypothetical protein
MPVRTLVLLSLSYSDPGVVIRVAPCSCRRGSVTDVAASAAATTRAASTRCATRTPACRPERTNGFFIASVECRQTDVREFLLTQSEVAPGQDFSCEYRLRMLLRL